MKTRSLGILFVAAVILPSVLLAVLSIRSAGREQAFVERELATTLLAEVTYAAGIAAAEADKIALELRNGLDVPAGEGYATRLQQWRKASLLVAVPFLLSPSKGILWPRAGVAAGTEERRFLEENGAFLTDRAPTAVFENIAVRYREQVLAEAELKKAAAKPEAAPAGQGAVSESKDEEPWEDEADDALERREAIDTFAQSAEIQSKVLEQAREKGDVLNLRSVAPASKASRLVDRATADENAAGQAAGAAPVNQAAVPTTERAAAVTLPAVAASAPAPAPAPAPVDSARQQSQFVVTSQLLSQIAAQGDYGIIPRFVGSRITFLFWEKQADGRIAGCAVVRSLLKARIAAALPPSFTPARLLTVLDEEGSPLIVPPGAEGRDWRQPFAAREIGESLPRWEAVALLTDPAAVAARARAASRTIWILAVILFVAVAGGGTMVLSSVYGELRLARRKTSFVANVSHELKTPLTSISLFVEMLRQKRQPDPEKQQRYYSLMASETERLTRLINNVLDFSSLEKGKKTYAKKAVSLAEVASEIVESQRIRLESKGFSVSFTAPPGARPGGDAVLADPEAIKQVILNLLSNAEKYSASAKSIEVEVRAEQGGLAVHVRDRGIGVAEKDREKIFREFYRVDDSLSARVQGTGLGLTIAQRIARAHGGELVCLPREGGGSDFVLRLPAAPGGSEAGT